MHMSIEVVDVIEVAKHVMAALIEIMQGPVTIENLYKAEENGDFPVPLEAVTDARSLFEAAKAGETKTPAEDSLVLCILVLKEALRCGRLARFWWVDTRDMLADALTKGVISRSAVLETSNTGVWPVKFPTACHPLVLKKKYAVSGGTPCQVAQ